MNKKLAALAAYLLYRRMTRAERKRDQTETQDQYAQPTGYVPYCCAPGYIKEDTNQ